MRDILHPRRKMGFWGSCDVYDFSRGSRVIPVCCENRFDGVMVSVLVSNAVDRGFEPRSGQTKDYKIGIYCFSDKHTAVRRQSEDWLARNQNNVSEWSDMSICRLLFQRASTIKIQLIFISLKIYLFSPWYIWKIAELALNNNPSLLFAVDDAAIAITLIAE